MSYEGSDDEWEVVDIVHTSTVSVKHEPEPLPAKKEDVDALAQQIRNQLSLKTTHDTQQILLLQQKMKEQQRMSDQQLRAIQSQLQQITELALNTQHQNAHLENERNQIYKNHRQQMLDQQGQIAAIKRLQLNSDAQIQQHNTQIAAAQKAVLTAQQQNIALLTNATLPPPPSINHNNHNNNNRNNKNKNKNNNNNNANSNASNGWLPAFPSIPWNFNNNNNNSNSNGNGNRNNRNNKGALQHNNNNNHHGQSSSANHNVLDMDMSPYNQAEEKSNVLMADDDDVLDWTNDYGTDEQLMQQLHNSTNPIADNPKLLKTHGVIGEGKFEPDETRQCGWVLKNRSSLILRLKTHLECLGGDKEEFGMRVQLEKTYEFAIKPNEEVYILIETIAPSIPGKYCSFYQMVMDDGSKIGEMLEVTCEVKPKFSSSKEKKIAQCIKMGFDRKKVVYTLQKHKWKVNSTVNELISSS